MVERQGQDGHFHTWVPPVRTNKSLSSNKSWTEWHIGKQKFTRWYTGISKLFNGMCVTMNFCNGIGLNDSNPFHDATYSMAIYYRTLQLAPACLSNSWPLLAMCRHEFQLGSVGRCHFDNSWVGASGSVIRVGCSSGSGSPSSSASERERALCCYPESVFVLRRRRCSVSIPLPL